MSHLPLTALDLKELHDDLHQRVREELDTFIGAKVTPDIVDRMKTAVGAQIHMFLEESGIEKTELDFSFDITIAGDNWSLALVAKGLLAQQFLEAVHFGTERVDPDQRAGLRPFDPFVVERPDGWRRAPV